MQSGFIARLDDASASLRAERKDITPIKSEDKIEHEDLDEDRYKIQSQAKDLVSFIDSDCEDKDDEAYDGRNLLSLCSEYIFDLFDANMLDDYHTVAAFENRAVEAFVDFNSDEISFAQESLHKEFLSLFENLISAFLHKYGCSTDAFYKQVNDYIHSPIRNTRDAAKKTSADEIVDVIFCYTDLRMWCDAMRERARMRAKYATRHSALIDSNPLERGLCSPIPKTLESSVCHEQTALQEVTALALSERRSPSQTVPAVSHRFDVT